VTSLEKIMGDKTPSMDDVKSTLIRALRNALAPAESAT